MILDIVHVAITGYLQLCTCNKSMSMYIAASKVGSSSNVIVWQATKRYTMGMHGSYTCMSMWLG